MPPDEVLDMDTVLSAGPTVENPEAPAPPETPEVVPETTEETENAALAAEVTAETPEGEAAPEAEEHKRSRAAERRIAELVKERERLKGQLNALSQQPRQPRAAPVPMQDPTAPPNPDQYKDKDGNLDEIALRVDLALWQRDQKARDAKFQAERSKIMEKFPDLPDLIAADNLRNAQGQATANATVAALIKESEVPGDLWHYLLSHPDEAIQIAQSTPLQSAKAIGKIEALLTAPKSVPGKPPEKPLPPPITPVKTGKAGGPPRLEFTEY